MKKGSEIIPSMVTQFPKKDSLQIWHREFKADSLNVEVENDSYRQNYVVKLKKQKKDSLSITPEINGILPIRERFQLNSSTPLVKIDETKINVFRKDSTKSILKHNMMNLTEIFSSILTKNLQKNIPFKHSQVHSPIFLIQ